MGEPIQNMILHVAEVKSLIGSLDYKLGFESSEEAHDFVLTMTTKKAVGFVNQEVVTCLEDIEDLELDNGKKFANLFNQ
jgi:hypothetical protein